MASLNMTTGLIPLPPYRRRLVVTRDHQGRWSKPAGIGWSALGPRTVRGITLHRLDATLWERDRALREPAAPTLLDWGVDHQTGDALLWNDPVGEVTPWASGPIADPYGDGAAYLDHFADASGIGAEVADRDRVNLGIAGTYVHPGRPRGVESPWSETSRQAVAQICAHYAHDAGIPWHRFPEMTAAGLSFIAWHHEFAQGGGTVCPGRLVMDLTNDLVERIRLLMRVYQAGGELPVVPAGIVYPDGLSPARAAELFGQIETVAYQVRFDERDPVARLWLEIGDGRQGDRYPRLVEVIDGRIRGERFYHFRGGLLIRRKDQLAEVIATSGRARGPVKSREPAVDDTHRRAKISRATDFDTGTSWETRRRGEDGPSHLTEREREVLLLLVEGMRDSEIATYLRISTRTAECHVKNLLRKLNLPNRTAAAAYAVRFGIGRGRGYPPPPLAFGAPSW